MKKQYILVFTLLLLFLTSCAYAENSTDDDTAYTTGEANSTTYSQPSDTQMTTNTQKNIKTDSDDLEVTTDKETAKMGETVELIANKKTNDTSPVIFKINYVTIKNSTNQTLKITPVNNQASYNFTIPDGWRAKSVIVTAVTAINNNRVEKSTTFNITKMPITLTNVTTQRNKTQINITAKLVDEHEHPVKGSNTFIVKVDGVTLKNNTKNIYFTTQNSTLNINFTLNEKLSDKNVTITLVTGDRYSYLGLRENITSIFKDETQIVLKNISTSNTTNITIPVSVTDSNGELVKDGRVTLYLDSKLLGTNRLFDGQRNLSIFTLPLGTYTLKAVYTSDLYQESETTATLTIRNKTFKTRNTKIASVFVKLYTNVTESDVTKWVESGMTDVYVQARQASNETENLLHVIDLCKDTNIKVHAWIICFKETGTFDLSEEHQDNLKKFISNVIKIDGVEGICLDYARYSGTNKSIVNVSVITNFVKDVSEILNNYNDNLELSMTVFPEKEGTKVYYGQDYKALSQYVDFLMPMTYKYDYNKDTAWIQEVTEYVINQSTHAKVVPIITTYKNNTAKSNWLSTEELTADINAILETGAYGYSLFYKTAIDTYPKIY